MAAVPNYTGTLDVAVGAGSPTAPLRVDTPVDAFGGDIGKAQQQFGAAESQSGNEIFTRALAMQEVQNQADARDAQTKYALQADNINSAFLAKSGRDAGPDALAAHNQSLADLRTQMTGDLQNPAVQRMFQSDSANTFIRNAGIASAHAARESRAYAVQTADSRIQAAQDTTFGAPDEQTYQANLATAKQAAIEKGNLLGQSPETISQNVATEQSKVAAQRLQGLAKTNPMLAKQLFDQYSKDGTLRGISIGQTEAQINTQLHIQGPRNIAAGINNGSSLALGQTVIDIDRARDAIGTFESGNSYGAIGPVVEKGQYKGQQALGKYQVMPGNLPTWLQQAGLPSMTKEQFVANPDAQEKVFESVFGGLMQKHGSFNAAANAWFTGSPNPPASANDGQTTAPAYLAGTNAILARSATTEDKVNAGRRVADTQAPNDVILADMTQQRILAEDAQARTIQRDNDVRNQNTLDNELLGASGKIPTSIDDLTPDGQAAYAQLSSSDQLKFVKKLAQNVKGDVPLTNERLQTISGLRGMAINDPNKFLEQDLMSADIPRAEKKKLLSTQQDILKHAQADPHAQQAMSALKPMLDAAGLNSKTDSTVYNQFTGALQDELSDYIADNKRLPKPADVQEMGRRLLAKQTINKSFLGIGYSSDTPTYQLQPSDKDVERIKADWKGSTVPTEDQIQRQHVREQYKILYPSRAPQAPARPQTTASRGPVVPGRE